MSPFIHECPIKQPFLPVDLHSSRSLNYVPRGQYDNDAGDMVDSERGPSIQLSERPQDRHTPLTMCSVRRLTPGAARGACFPPETLVKAPVYCCDDRLGQHVLNN